MCSQYAARYATYVMQAPAVYSIVNQPIFYSTCTLARLLIKGGVYSRAVSFRGNTVLTLTPQSVIGYDTKVMQLIFSLGQLHAAQKVLLVQPPSVMSKKAFSPLNVTFDQQQGSCLQDYKEASIMLQYNDR